MTTAPTPGDAFLERMEDVSARLGRHAVADPSAGLTSPDPPTGEQWEWGQVWAHLAEFVPFWLAQVRLIVAATGDEPVPFGRIKSDTERIGAIERDRDRPAPQLWTRLQGHLVELRGVTRTLPVEAWSKRGVHQTLGVMELPRVFEEFLVGHLEQHADQFDGLAAGATPKAP